MDTSQGAAAPGEYLVSTVFCECVIGDFRFLGSVKLNYFIFAWLDFQKGIWVSFTDEITIFMWLFVATDANFSTSAWGKAASSNAMVAVNEAGRIAVLLGHRAGTACASQRPQSHHVGMVRIYRVRRNTAPTTLTAPAEKLPQEKHKLTTATL